ncbi:response regulator [Planomonospora sp. ID82291]|uniref:response regulator n=1 Tax=Planomonospora sp. ID82291 TaxID=2738136 RepID=UPI0018C4412A|nr:response regulator [Planomonospora sp. ID82291]MBG0816626.1 response regulator [Planomonospora sp. ID82291]
MMRLSPSRVLLVEDNPNDLELAQLAFERGRFANQVDVARDGAEALDYLSARGAFAHRDPDDLPRVILLDIKLPLIDGIEVLSRIKNDQRLRHIPVVMLTSSAEDRDLAACYALGANSYIVKPVDMEQFFNAIQNIGVYWLLLNHPDDHIHPADVP